MSKLITVASLSVDTLENLPASAPMSMIAFACDRLTELWMKWVSIWVRYLPIRVFAAFSQCVSSEKSFGRVSAKTISLLQRLSYGFYFNIYGQQGKFFAALGAFSFVLLENFVWRFELCTIVQHMFTSLADDALWHKSTSE